MDDHNVKKIVSAGVSSIQEIFRAHHSSVGYRVPLYQRNYDWDTEHVGRLFETIINGLSGSTKHAPLTFLGTLILAKEKNETTFKGNSLSVVDGQQRLTTFLLVIAKLIEQFELLKKPLLKEKAGDLLWLSETIDDLANELYVCILSKQNTRHKDDNFYIHYPVLVREEDGDNRAASARDAEYRSNIARYLFDLGQQINEDKLEDEFEFKFNERDPSSVKMENSLKEIASKIRDIQISESIALEDFKKTKFRDLLRKESGSEDDKSNYEKLMSDLIKRKDVKLNELIRLVFFSYYLLDKVALTTVEVAITKEDYAFDIFDSLNTTGEPLTAIQTLKPLVVQHLSVGKYKGSLEEGYFKEIDRYLSVFSGNEAQQNESKELVISFRYYTNGKKIPKALREQRYSVRDTYRNLISGDLKEKYVKAITEVAKYKEYFWNKNSDIESKIDRQDDRYLLALCLSFIRETKTSLTIPILTRYWLESQKLNNTQLFNEAIKAITAFMVIRRAYTGSTEGIDADFQNILSPNGRSLCLLSPKDSKNPLNSIVETNQLKEYLKDYLIKKIGAQVDNKIDKEGWSRRSATKGLYKSSKPLCKILLLAAMNQSKPCEKNPMLLQKLDIKRGKWDHLQISQWDSSAHETIEHIAPDNPDPNSEWDKNIYTKDDLKHSIGNLSLLPQGDNSSVGNKNWEEKRSYFEAFTLTTKEDLKDLENRAKKLIADEKTREKFLQRLRKREEALPDLETIISVEKWDAEIIEKRGRNITELAWKELAPWLDIDI